ncbi:hypothetical protein GTP45_09290 [Pseudoduganella sp. FT55W]|uniref:Cell wall polymerase n=1 Tax=Duganella rivi TaxID=2666083 RepID=A0A7X4GQ16_9BURK|nr:hypothetical protein [Duganella rivi]MYM67021.1 hypothetical protein [Duganella rivi]
MPSVISPGPWSKEERNFQLAFVVFSGLSVLSGTVAMMATGGAPGLWLRNPVMWGVTLMLCVGLRRLHMPPPWVVIAIVSLLALSLLVGPDQAGVHRWLAVGPVQLNVAALVIPLGLLLADRGVRHAGQPRYAIAVLAIAMILAWQPDMSQLSALIAALLIWAIARRSVQSLLWVAPMALLALFFCAGRPDPLEPVPHVEGIFHLAAEVSPMLAFCGGLCLLLTALSPLALANDLNRRPVAAGLTAYFLVSGFAWLFGAFPVPLAGYGISFILGWLIGATALLMK